MRLTSSKLGLLRHAANLTQKQAAEKLGKHVVTLSGWERGEVMPTDLMIEKLAEVYGSTVEVVGEAAGSDGRAYADRLAAYRREV